MQKIFFILSIPFIMFSGLACESECDSASTAQFEYMIFGHYYGKCSGEECVEIYKFDREHLYEDSTDVYPDYQTAYAGEYYLLSDTKFQEVKDLLDYFPAALYAEQHNVIGMPDFADGGGIYVEMKFKNGEAMSGFWLLDQMESNMPQVYNDFVDKVNEKIASIHQ